MSDTITPGMQDNFSTELHPFDQRGERLVFQEYWGYSHLGTLSFVACRGIA